MPLLFLALLLVAMPAFAEWYSDEQAIMGTRVSVSVWHDDQAGAEALLNRSMAEMRRVDAAFSPYREDSELSRLNREAAVRWVNVSDELWELLQRARQVSEWSDGAFDITFASVGRFYDYREGRQPTADEREAVEAIGYRHVELDAERHRVRYLHPQTYVDLGGIAKGHAVDRVSRIIMEAGVHNASVSAGGDSRIIGDRRGKPWHIGIRDPRDEQAMVAILPLMDVAVSTSGDYERYFEEGGVRFHHILDPSTGASADGAMGVTVLGPEATLTDALSTTIFVLGVERGLAFANRIPGIDAIIVDPAGKLHFTDGLSDLQSD